MANTVLATTVLANTVLANTVLATTVLLTLGPPSTSAHRPRMSSMEASSLCPGARLEAATSPNPARCQTSSCISRIKVLACSL